MSGPQIEQLHDALEVMGMVPVRRDAYTWVTQEAVALAQKSLGITPADGFYCPDTARAMNEVLRRKQGSLRAA